MSLNKRKKISNHNYKQCKILFSSNLENWKKEKEVKILKSESLFHPKQKVYMINQQVKLLLLLQG